MLVVLVVSSRRWLGSRHGYGDLRDALLHGLHERRPEVSRLSLAVSLAENAGV